MQVSRAEALFRRIDTAESRWCRRLNRGSRTPVVGDLFRVVSRLGDGVLWYSLMLVLPFVYGERGLHTSLKMAAAGLVGLLVYRQLKHRLVRERPYITQQDVWAGTPPLDRFSFPSGHTLHAVAFTLVVVGQIPVLGWVLVPFAVLVAASRVVLGLHYPTDVAAGAALGATFGTLALQLPLG